MAGKVCLITGATSGLGLETACGVAALGATVVLAGRSDATCTAAVATVRARTGNPELDWLAADLSVQDEVRALAEEVTRRHSRVDVLVNNAGAVFQGRRLSADGVELTFAVNHLATFLLTTALLDSLRAATAARVVTVSSVAHERERLDFDDLQLERGYRPFRAYARSKLANLLFTYELARRLEGTGITVNAVNPGLVRTPLGAKDGRLVRLGWQLVQWRYRGVAVSAAEGARTSVYLASSPAVEGISGGYFSDCTAVPSSPASHDAAAQAKLWTVSQALTAPTRDHHLA